MASSASNLHGHLRLGLGGQKRLRRRPALRLRRGHRVRLPAGVLIRVGGSASMSPQQGSPSEGVLSEAGLPGSGCRNRAAMRSVSAIPWRNSEPDALISPFCLFAGHRTTGNRTHSRSKLGQRLIQSRAGPDARLRAELRFQLTIRFAIHSGAAASQRGAGPVECAAAHQNAP